MQRMWGVKKVFSFMFLALMVSVLLTACGGGGGGGSDGGGGNNDGGGGSAPSAPQNVQSTAADGQVTISWDSVNGAASYNIYWSTTSGVTKSNGTKITGATSPNIHAGLTNGMTYYYIATAVNSVGESVPSSEVSATPQAPISVPSAPQNVQAAAGDGQITISWDSVAGATSYNIYWNTTAGVTTSNNKITGAVSPRNHTGLTNNTTYYYIVTAVNSVGESVPSSEVSATPQATTTTIVYSYDFEGGWGNWWVDNGVWEIGTPTSGPNECYGGTQCAGTILNGNYPADTDSRLVSPTIQLPPVTGFEEVHLRFWNWFSYASYDSGQVQVQVWDSITSTWGAWVNVGTSVWSVSGGWSLKDVDLTAYAGNTVRIAFYHVANCGGNLCTDWSVSTGWYIDDIEVVRKVPVFTGGFEAGLGDWGTDNGVWQIGLPTAGPVGCYTGTQCAGTVLNDNYPANTDSRLVSPTIQLPSVTGFEEVHLRFWNWFSYASYDSGQVQVQVWDSITSTWGAWVNVGTSVWSVSGGWSLKDVDLTAYAGNTVRIAFYHVANCGGNLCTDWSVSTGWYIDDIQIQKF